MLISNLGLLVYQHLAALRKLRSSIQSTSACSTYISYPYHSPTIIYLREQNNQLFIDFYEIHLLNEIKEF